PEGADITEMTSSGVTYNDNETDTWHLTGTIKGRVNNWNGNVTYAGGTTNPTYTFTSTKGETQDSTIAPVSGPGFHLQESVRTNLRSFQRSVQQIRPVCRTTPAYCTYR